MDTYTQILYQIVFGTKYAKPDLIKKNREKLYRYIWGILKNKKCHLYKINGVENHIHILTHIHPGVSLSSLVKDIKIASNLFIKEEKLFPGFQGWQRGYGAFTHHVNDKPRLVKYIENQEVHHRKESFKDELKKIFEENGVRYDEKYLFKNPGD